MEAFNSAVDAGETWRLAQPSDDACGYCPHILRCPEIWAQGGTKELDELEVLEGTVKRVQQAQVGSVAVELDATGGTRLGVVTITGLDPRRLDAAMDLHPGEKVRVSGLRSRPYSDDLLRNLFRGSSSPTFCYSPLQLSAVGAALPCINPSTNFCLFSCNPVVCVPSCSFTIISSFLGTLHIHVLASCPFLLQNEQ